MSREASKGPNLFVLSSWAALLFLLVYSIGLYYTGINEVTKRIGRRLSSYQGICLTDTDLFAKAISKQRRGFPPLLDRHNFESIVSNLSEHFNDIWMPMRLRSGMLQLASDADESKYALPLADFDEQGNLGCNVITIGVGHNIRTEELIARIYGNQCKFLGVDPAEEVNRALMGSLPNGHFLKAAIGGKGAKAEPTVVLRADNRTNREKLKHLDFADLLRWHNGGKTVDLLLVDPEGGEYPIMERLAEQHGILPPICQLNMEVHHPALVNASLSSFLDAFERLLTSGRFALFQSDLAKHYFREIQRETLFYRIFLVNVFDEQCVRKYLC